MKKLVHQYITSGRDLPEYQFNKLSNNQVKSYLNIRVRSNRPLPFYAFVRLDDNNLESYIEKGWRFTIQEYNHLSDNQAKVYLNMRIERVKQYDNDLRIFEFMGLDKLDKKSTANYLQYLAPKNSGVANLLYRASQSGAEEAVTEILLTYESFIKNIGSKAMSSMLSYSTEPKTLINRINKISNGRGDEKIANFNSYQLEHMIKYGKITPLEMADLLFSNEELVRNMTPDNMLKITSGIAAALNYKVLTVIAKHLLNKESFMSNASVDVKSVIMPFANMDIDKFK